MNDLEQRVRKCEGSVIKLETILTPLPKKFDNMGTKINTILVTVLIGSIALIGNLIFLMVK